MRLLLLFVPLSLLLTGCGSSAASAGASPLNGSALSQRSIDAPLWSREGLDAQWRVEWLRQRMPPGLGYSPGTTPWRPVVIDPVPGIVSPDVPQAATAGALLAEMALRLGPVDGLGEEVWEQTTRIWFEAEDEAVGVILRWGLKDDSVAGHDHRVTMRRGVAGWYVEAVEERDHCSRGVTAEGRCL